ncbi:phage tail assembly chaperone G [Staphylococcus schleiferi]|uniref:phage tail assembly chaperone G n=1 Tax=Staphylococcus schleiferi TaxID=1295 RepID=UPI0021CEA0F5|nr:hypothetical protein [Staphylococcus schleiferi]UXR56790.1 hypothetical protein MUA40_09250 [Staphylococcus schleiferi]UXR59074.1 hypothetical protein MUA91_09250 [Staphylococcus schleiferi]
MARPSIELITGYTKAGKPQTKKYLAKPIITLFDTIQGTKLARKMQNLYADSNFKELTEEEYAVLSETEKEEYNDKLQEQEKRTLEMFDAIEEITTFIAEMFGNQFTSEELQKGLESGEKGFETLSEVLGTLIAGDVDETKKFVTEKTK